MNTERIFYACVFVLVAPLMTVCAVRNPQLLRLESWFGMDYEDADDDPASAGLREVLFFHAPWCGPCRSMKPIVAQMKHEGYRLRGVNIDHHRALAEKYKIHAVPTFVFLKNGKEVKRFSGTRSPEELHKLCKAYRVASVHYPASHTRLAAP